MAMSKRTLAILCACAGLVSGLASDAFALPGSPGIVIDDPGATSIRLRAGREETRALIRFEDGHGEIRRFFQPDSSTLRISRIAAGAVLEIDAPILGRSTRSTGGAVFSSRRIGNVARISGELRSPDSGSAVVLLAPDPALLGAATNTAGVTAVPEPHSAVLFAAAAVLVGLRVERRARAT